MLTFYSSLPHNISGVMLHLNTAILQRLHWNEHIDYNKRSGKHTKYCEISDSAFGEEAANIRPSNVRERQELHFAVSCGVKIGLRRYS